MRPRSLPDTGANAQSVRFSYHPLPFCIQGRPVDTGKVELLASGVTVVHRCERPEQATEREPKATHVSA